MYRIRRLQERFLWVVYPKPCTWAYLQLIVNVPVVLRCIYRYQTTGWAVEEWQFDSLQWQETFPIHNVHVGCGVFPTWYKCTDDSFCRCKSTGVWRWWFHRYLVLVLRMWWAVPPLPHTCSCRGAWDSLTLNDVAFCCYRVNHKLIVLRYRYSSLSQYHRDV